MKNRFLTSCFILLFLSSAQAETRFTNGSFVELGLGAQFQKNKALSGTGQFRELQKINIFYLYLPPESTIPLTNMLKPLSAKNSSGFVPALNFGMLFFPNPEGCLVLGFTAGFALGGGSTRIKYPQVSQATVNALVSEEAQAGALETGDAGTNTLLIKDRSQLKAAFRIGAAFGNVMPFANIGFAVHRLTFAMDGAQRFSKWDCRLVLGLGVDYAVSQNIIAGLLAETHIGSVRSLEMQMYEKNMVMGNGQFRSKSVLCLATFKYMFPSRK